MNNPMIQLIILGLVAFAFIFKLRSVLGTRTGFEPDSKAQSAKTPKVVVDNDAQKEDISDHIPLDSVGGQALLAMKHIEPDFCVTEFMSGAAQAYEMILMAYEGDDLETLSQFLSEDVFEHFAQAIDARQSKGLTVDAQFVGLKEITLIDAEFDAQSNTGEITLSLCADLTSEIRDESGKLVQGDKQTIKTQCDEWTFARIMGSDDPNWLLVASS